MTRRIAIGVAIGVAILVAWWLRRPPDRAPDAGPAVATPRARIKVLLHPDAGTIAGDVTAAGKPIVATACVRAVGDDRARPRCTTTDEHGAFAIADLAPGPYAVWASADGFALVHPLEPVRVTSGARTSVTIALVSSGVPVAGVVRDARDRPIGGALIVVAVPALGRDAIASTATTDGDGHFRAWAPAGEVAVRASADGFVDGEVGAIAPADDVAFTLLPESTLSGTVIDARTRATIADAAVVAGDEHARTDADGHFTIRKLVPGRYKPTATAIGGYGEAAESVRVGLGESVDHLVIELHPVAAVIGQIANGDRAWCPPDAGSVELVRYGSAAIYRAKTLIDGTIVLEGVVPGSYQVSVECKGFLPQVPYPDLTVGDSDVDGVIWKVAAGARITGRVVDRAGTPIAGATVNHLDAGHAMGGSVVAGADGAFVLDGVVPGAVDLRAYARGFTPGRDPTRVTAVLGTPVTATVVMARGGTIAGRVATAAGAPVANARVRLDGADNDDTRTDARGEFAFGELAGGDYTVVLDEDATEVPARAAVHVDAGGSARVTLVAAPPSGVIAGRVVDPTGAPIVDAWVEVAREDAEAFRGRGSWSDPPILTGLDGRFRVTALAAGTYAVHARRTGGAEGIVEHVALGGEVRVVLAPTGVLAGVVTTPSGAPIDDVTVLAEDRAHDRSRGERLFHTGGRFALRELPAGRYRLTVDSDVRSAVTIELADGERREELHLVVQPRFTIRGRLVSAAGAPLAGWKIEAPRLELQEAEATRSIEVSTIEYALTDADGRFLVRDMPAGPLERTAADTTRDPDAPARTIAKLDLAGSVNVSLGDVRVPP